MKHLILAASEALDLAPGPAAAQPSAAPDPGNLTRYSRGITARYDNIKRDIVEAAEAVPESEYGFKPTPEVRSFGEIIAHVADSRTSTAASPTAPTRSTRHRSRRRTAPRRRPSER